MGRPTVIVFDVNETLSDLSPMGSVFAEFGAPPELAQVWFASVLRDGFALATVGSAERFATVGRQLARQLVSAEAADRIVEAFTSLSVHADVVDGVRGLRAAGLRLVTLTNGSTSVADGLLTRAGLRDQFEQLLSVETPGIWKPARAAYDYAAWACGAEPDELMLVAVHPWDIDGASRAGLQTAWLNRHGAEYPPYFTQPTHSIEELTVLPRLLASSHP